MIAIDSNVLVYAHRADAAFHGAAREAMQGLVQGRRRFAIPWPCAHEFIAVVTHPRVYRDPTPLEQALDVLDVLHGLEHCDFLGEGADHLEMLRATAVPAQARCGAIHDARIAALCLQHGVSELWSADRDFSRYPSLRLRNPLIA